jgi:hypothetical protein
MIVPAGVVDKKTGHWRYKAENYLLPALYPFRGRDAHRANPPLIAQC